MLRHISRSLEVYLVGCAADEVRRIRYELMSLVSICSPNLICFGVQKIRHSLALCSRKCKLVLLSVFVFLFCLFCHVLFVLFCVLLYCLMHASVCISSSEALTSLTSSLQTLIEINSFDQLVTKTEVCLSSSYAHWTLTAYLKDIQQHGSMYQTANLSGGITYIGAPWSLRYIETCCSVMLVWWVFSFLFYTHRANIVHFWKTPLSVIVCCRLN